MSNPDVTDGRLAGHHARYDAIALAARLPMTVTRRIVATVRALAAWPRALWRAIQRDTERRRAVAALRALDDRMLRDMGITRSEIAGVVEGRAHCRPTGLAELRELPRLGSGVAVTPATRSEDLPRRVISIAPGAERRVRPAPAAAVDAQSARSSLRPYVDLPKCSGL